MILNNIIILNNINQFLNVIFYFYKYKIKILNDHITLKQKITYHTKNDGFVGFLILKVIAERIRKLEWYSTWDC
jgi:hypothetical protein